MSIHYQSASPANPSGLAGWQGLDIFFARVPNPPSADKNVEELRRGFDKAVRKLHLAAQTEGQFIPIFNQILDAANSSLCAPGASINDGNERLDDIKSQILTLARRRRSGYFASLLLIGVLVSSLGMLMYFIALVVPQMFIDKTSSYFVEYKGSLTWLLPACLVLPGVAIGVVFIGFATNRLVSYEGVGTMDQYDFIPWQRFTWVALVAYVLFIAIWFDIFVLGVGNVELNKVTTEAHYGLLIGLVCGVSESAITELLLARFRPVLGQNKADS